MDRPPAIEVLYDDSTIVVVNKPTGLPTLVDGYQPQAPYLAGLLCEVYGRVWVVHRLDKGTSGVMVFARTAQAHRDLNLQFERREALKIYHALVRGDPPWEEKRVALPLLIDADRWHRTRVDYNRGKPARTDLRLLEHFGRWALIEAVPHTGRRHQIRAHLAATGYPLAADPLYEYGRILKNRSHLGGIEVGPLQLLINRPALHAWQLSFSHPSGQKRMQFSAAYPPDIARALENLRRQPC